MQVINEITAIRDYLSGFRSAGQSIGFVPTMGALHEGHLSLVRASIAANDLTVVSIFINPAQFAPHEDLDSYPVHHEADLARLQELGVQCVFMPDKHTMYDVGRQVHITLPELSNIMCGVSRPVFFPGIALVVTKLFVIVQPSRAYFGQKDFQQCVIVKTLIKELFLPIEMVCCPIVREADGLAMSSRNEYLSEAERTIAPQLHKSLLAVKELSKTEHKTARLREAVEHSLAPYPEFELDYFEIIVEDGLKPADELQPGRTYYAAIAAMLGKTRLIDNICLND